MVSCKKETKVTPHDPAAPKSINVEYRVQSESGMVNVTYVAPDASGKLVTQKVAVNRTTYSNNFNATNGNFFSVEASNINPSHKVVQVQIFIDGVLFKEGTTTDPTVKAIASGNY